MKIDFQKIERALDDDQKKILFILSLYSSEEDLVFLQYTGWLTLSFYLMTQNLFPNYKEQLLVYDYKTDRRYLWEDKKYMKDVNILRQHALVIRARTRSFEYRDVNSHQCSTIGLQFLRETKFSESPDGKKILAKLSCKKCSKNLVPIFENEQPVLQCPTHKNSRVIVEGFLRNLYEPIAEKIQPFFL